MTNPQLEAGTRPTLATRARAAAATVTTYAQRAGLAVSQLADPTHKKPTWLRGAAIAGGVALAALLLFTLVVTPATQQDGFAEALVAGMAALLLSGMLRKLPQLEDWRSARVQTVLWSAREHAAWRHVAGPTVLHMAAAFLFGLYVASVTVAMSSSFIQPSMELLAGFVGIFVAVAPLWLSLSLWALWWTILQEPEPEEGKQRRKHIDGFIGSLLASQVAGLAGFDSEKVGRFGYALASAAGWSVVTMAMFYLAQAALGAVIVMLAFGILVTGLVNSARKLGRPRTAAAANPEEA